jgi:carbon monoxide dehydrogenase subunit G
MHLEGETDIAAGRPRVWAVLTDPHAVADCVSGEAKIEFLDERNFRVTGQVGNAFMRATVTVEIELTELVEPERARASATAAVMGSPVVATGSLTLEEAGSASTRASWSAEVTLGGMLASFAGMVQAPLQEAIERTLDCLKTRIEAETEASGLSPT